MLIISFASIQWNMGITNTMMKENVSYQEARDLLLEYVKTVGVERCPLEEAGGRNLAEALAAGEDVPAFDRSAYDGYAFRAEDVREASKNHPVTLRILEEVPAGSVPCRQLTPGTAVKILTGAPIPEGADAVVMYEKTVFTEETVTLSAPLSPGDNIIRAGEDVRKGQILAQPGTVIDAGLSGALAAQGVYLPSVFRKPLVGILSTGSELVDKPAEGAKYCPVNEVNGWQHWHPTGQRKSDITCSNRGELPPGKIRNTGRYILTAALQNDGCQTVFLGTAPDDPEQILKLLLTGQSCDLILLTGGVSAGDYDLTAQAMEGYGCTILVRGVDLKPGMACCYGVKGKQLVCGLSGNPVSALANYYAVVRPAVRRLAGRRDFLPEEFPVVLQNDFAKKSRGTRILKGILRFPGDFVQAGQSGVGGRPQAAPPGGFVQAGLGGVNGCPKAASPEGFLQMEIPAGQGNVMISSSIGCNLMAIVPEGSGPLKAGTVLRGFLV